jgi:hypothetical protein
MKNWVITWESWGPNRVEGKDKIAAILNENQTAEYVREIVELLYINHECNLGERLRYANGGHNLCQTQIGEKGEAPGEFVITCGYDPHLCARRVEDCRVEGNGSKEKLVWDQ